jgi:phosphoribosyl-ATP pyrophosphohydrolase/phosphoribosyl-AMP cyclohydrolase
MNPDFSKYPDGLMPVIVQDADTNVVLMLGYMNEEAYAKTQKEARVTFFSRSRNSLWTKGETSGNFLFVKDIRPDCDQDCLLVKTEPAGPVCHTGADTCFQEKNPPFSLEALERLIADRKQNPSAASYTSSLFAKGINKIAQKLGEEAVELVIESKDDDDEKFLGEAADLLYHYLVLLQARHCRLSQVIEVLAGRQK